MAKFCYIGEDHPKIARLENDPHHHDSWVALAGYAACGAEIELSK